MRFLLFLFFVLYTNISFAYTVSPLGVNCDYVQSCMVTIINEDSDKPLSYVTASFNRNVDAQGVNKKTENLDEDVLIIPPQGTVPEGGRQNIMIRYIGDITPEQSKHYYVNFSQINVTSDPVEVENNIEGVVTKVNFAFAYDVAVNFSSKGTKPSFQFSDVKIINETDEKTKQHIPSLSFTATNTGQSFVYLQDLKLSLKTSGGEQDLSADILRGAKNSPLLPTGLTRNFTVPLKEINVPLGSAELIIK